MRKSFLLLSFIFSSILLSAQTYEELIEKSSDCIEKNDYICAEQALKEALRKEPANAGNTLLLTNLGTIQRNLGKTEEALISYSAALAKSPKASFVLHNRAALYCAIDDYDNALKDYNSILITKEDDIEALYRRGLLYMSRNDLPAAKEDFHKIDEIEPENIWGQLGFANVHKQMNEWNKAEEIYSNLIAKHRTMGSLYYYRARCYANMDRNARAIEDLNKAIDLGYKKDPAAYAMRGEIRLNQYDKISARMDFLKAIELGANKESLKNLLNKCN